MQTGHIKNNIPTIYQKTYLDIAMFNFCLGVLDTIKNATIEQAITKFQRYYNLSEDEYPTSSALMTYQRMKQCYFELEKKQNGK